MPSIVAPGRGFTAPLFLAALLLGTGCSTTARPSAAPAPRAPASGVAELAAEVAAWVAAGDVVGAELIVIQGDEVLLHEAWGWADRQRRLPMERDGVISVKSLTKPVTATAVLMLVEDGALSLDVPLARYLPGWAGDARVSVRDLLLQTSGDSGGFGGGGYNVYEFDSLAAWVADWAAQASGGTYAEFAYSNFNYAALGYIVEVLTGAPVERFLEQRIFAPLDMQQTWTRFAPDTAWGPRVPVRYRLDAESGAYQGFWTNADAQPWSFFPAAFGLWMTGADYARFLRLWLDDGRRDGVALLTPQAVAQALAPPRDGSGAVSPYGYGWFVDAARTRDGRPVGFRHGGADGSIALAFPGSDALVIYLTQSQPAAHTSALYNQVCMSGLFDHPGPDMDWAAEHDVHGVPLDRAQRQEYLGTYLGTPDAGQGLELRVLEADGRLVLRLGERGRRVQSWFHLVPLGDDRFAYGRYSDRRLVGIDRQAELRFRRSDGRVVELELSSERGLEFRARRTGP